MKLVAGQGHHREKEGVYTTLCLDTGEGGDGGVLREVRVHHVIPLKDSRCWLNCWRPSLAVTSCFSHH